MIFLPGGPSHQDMFDLKMDAPSEIRGEFKPIRTNVPGIQICEHLPRLARLAWTRCAIIRSMVGATGRSRRLPMSDRPHRTRRSRRAAGPAWARCCRRSRDRSIAPIPPFVGLVAEDGPHAVGGRRQPGLSRRRRTRRSSQHGRRQGGHGAQRRHARPPGRPQDAADQLRSVPPRRRRQRHDGRDSTRSTNRPSAC